MSSWGMSSSWWDRAVFGFWGVRFPPHLPRYLGVQSVTNKMSDVFMSKLEVLHSKIIFTALLIECFHGWMSCRFWAQNLLGIKSNVSLIWVFQVESYFLSFSTFLSSPFHYLHSIFYFNWSFLDWLKTDKHLALQNTSPKLQLQIILILLGNFFFLSLFSVIFSSFIIVFVLFCFSLHGEDNEVVKQVAQKTFFAGDFQDHTWSNLSKLQ